MPYRNWRNKFSCNGVMYLPRLSGRKGLILSPGSSVSTGCEERDTRFTRAIAEPFSFPSQCNSKSLSRGRCNT